MEWLATNLIIALFMMFIAAILVIGCLVSTLFASVFGSVVGIAAILHFSKRHGVNTIWKTGAALACLMFLCGTTWGLFQH